MCAACCMTRLCVDTLFFFFFQAEDGIRDHCVTGVQTCALPICREVNARFALPQGSLASLEPLGKLYCAQQVVAQLIPHRRDDAEVWEADEEWRFDNSPNHQRRLPERQRDEKNCAPAHNKRTPVVTTPPDGDRGIHEKDKEQQQT